ncbi:MAG: tail fiber domain-containing protein [Turneriella sp.]
MSNKIVAFFFLLMAGAASALGKTGTDPGAPAGVGDFVAGNAAVAAEVNKQINILYKALNDGTNSINIDGWTNGSGNLGYTGGNFGIGLAPTANTRLTIHGTKNTLHQLIGDSASATGAPNTDVFAAMAFYGNGIKHAQIHFRPTLGNGTLVLGGSTSAANVLGVGQSLDIALAPNGGNVGIGTMPTGNKLDVSGTIGATNMNVTSSNAGWNSQFVNSAIGGNGVYVAGGNATAPAFQVDNYNASAILFRVHGNGEVGVGATPSSLTRFQSTFPSGVDRGVLSYSSNTTAANQTLYAAQYDAAINNQVDYFIAKAGTGASGSGSTGTIMVRIRGDGYSQFTNGTNTCTINTATSNMACSSDERLKTQVAPISDALAKLGKVRGVRFQWKASGLSSIGLLAQDVESVFPQAVTIDDRGMKMVAHNAMLGPIIAGINQLKSEKDTQVLALEKRATEAEQRYAAGLRQAQSDRELANRDKAAADARIAALEKRLNEELMARKQQDIRLAQLEQNFNRMALRFESQGRVVARK